MQSLICEYPRLDKFGWRYFAQGSYNYVYRSACGQSILKIPKKHHRYTEDPERALEVFCEIHPEWAHETKLFQFMYFKGWIMPYFKGRPADDIEIAKQLIDIYQRTGRIVLDAPAKQNFICTPLGEVICIDVGFAFRTHSSIHHSASDTSLIQWSYFKESFHRDFFHRPYNLTNFPQTTQIIKALLFLQIHLPDDKDCDFLLDDPQTAKYLAQCYEKNKSLSHHERQKAIEHILSFSFEHIQQRCIEILMQYLQSRCLMNQDFYDFQANPQAFQGELQLSWMSYFLHYECTLKNLKIVQSKIQKLSIAQNKKDLIKIFNHNQTNEAVNCLSTCAPTLEDSLLQCQSLIESSPFKRL